MRLRPSSTVNLCGLLFADFAASFAVQAFLPPSAAQTAPASPARPEASHQRYIENLRFPLYNLGRTLLVRRSLKPGSPSQTPPLEHRCCRTPSSRTGSRGDLHQPSCVLQSACLSSRSVHRTRRSSTTASPSQRSERPSPRSALAECTGSRFRDCSSSRRHRPLERHRHAGRRSRSRHLFRHQRHGGATQSPQEEELESKGMRKRGALPHPEGRHYRSHSVPMFSSVIMRAFEVRVRMSSADSEVMSPVAVPSMVVVLARTSTAFFYATSSAIQQAPQD